MDPKEKEYLPFIEMINTFNYTIKIEKFERINNNHPNNDNHKFSNYFPKYLEYVHQIDSLLGKYLIENYDEKKEIEKAKKNPLMKGKNVKVVFIKEFFINNISKHEEEIISFIGDNWKNLKVYTKVHITIFLYFAIQMIKNNFEIFNDYDINIMYWTILFHDSGKHLELNPYFKEDYSDFYYLHYVVDKVHPFKGVIIFLETMFKKNFIFFNDDKEKGEFKSNLDIFIIYLYKSFKKISKGKYNISFIHLKEIDTFLDYLHKEEKNAWIYDITVLILFHQSLPNHDKHMNNPLLPDEYILKYFDLRLLEMMRIIMVCDSVSHIMINDEEWVEQINKQLNIIRQKIIENNKNNK